MKIDQAVYKNYLNLRDRLSFQQKRKLESILQKAKQCADESKFAEIQKLFLSTFQQFETILQYKLSQISNIPFDQSLPIYQHKKDIQDAIKNNHVVIVCGDTGSGKTTQLPLYIAELGFGLKARIGCTQPRRIAASSIANRVADVMKSNMGECVGYEVRFDKKASDKTIIKFMTDGILLAETQNDLKLFQYDALIIDEAHERSLNIDFILGYIKEILPIRPELKIVISSATLEAKKFSEFFDDAPIFQVEGRTFPIEDFYIEDYSEEEDLDDLVDRGVNWVDSVDKTGDILVFLPGEKEIFDCERKIIGRNYSKTITLPLYARLSADEQQKIFKPSDKRKIILATNVAETSLTIPGIRYVVDSGLARISRYSGNSQIQKLQTEWVSKANVKQRRGRCGRVQDGICVHLYTKEIFEEMPEFADPEIRRSSLAGVILQMKKLKLRDIADFSFIDPPNKKMIQSAYQSLYALSAIDSERNLTPIGEKLLSYPLDPHLSRMILYAAENDCLHEIIVLVAVLSAQDPRERPNNATPENLDKQRKWDHEKSDFLTLLNLWSSLKNEKETKTNSQFKRFLKDHFLSYRKWDEWKNIYRELIATVHENKLRTVDFKMSFDAIHQSLLSGLPSFIGYLDEKQCYRGYGGQEFFIFPGSVLFKKTPKWVFSFALVETTKLYARTVAECNPQWLEKIYPHLCKYQYSDAYWNENQGCPYAMEHVSLSGYPVILKRPVYFGRIDSVESRKIFILEALMNQKIHSKALALKKNQKMIEKLKYLEIKSRRINGLYNEHALFAFYDKMLPGTVHTTKQFDSWFYKQEKLTPNFLDVTFDDLFIPQLNDFSVEAFPELFDLNGHTLEIRYEYVPGKSHDGHTLICPLHLLGQLQEYHIDWAVEGFLSEKLFELFKTLPKNIRVSMQPMSEWVKGFLIFPILKQKTLIENLILYSKEKFGVEVSKENFKYNEISAYLNLRVVVVDDKNVILEDGRDLKILKEKLKVKADEEFEKVIEVEIPIANWLDWKKNRFTLQTKIKTKIGELNGFAALSCKNDKLFIKVFQSEFDAVSEHKKGLICLFEIENKDMVNYLYQRFPMNKTTMNYFRVLTKSSSGFEDFLASRVIERALQLDKTIIYEPDVYQDAMVRCRGEIVNCAEELARVFEESYEVCLQMNTVLKKCEGNLFQKNNLDFDRYYSLLFSADVFSRLSCEFILMLSKVLKGFTLRAERMQLSPLKDLQKSETIYPYFQKLSQWQKQKPELYFVKPEIICFIENLFLFHSSVFAQDIRLPKKISTKILDEDIIKVESQLLK